MKTKLVRKIAVRFTLEAFQKELVSVQNDGWTVCPESLLVHQTNGQSYPTYACFVERIEETIQSETIK